MPLMTAQEYANMLVVNANRELGKYERLYMDARIPELLKSIADVTLSKDIYEKIFTTIDERLVEYGLHDKTNIEVHFLGMGEAMSQYISPLERRYAIGATRSGIDEKVLYIHRPEHVKVGFIKEITESIGINKSLHEERSHEYGTCEDYFNIVVLHTYEYSAEGTSSTIHITVLVPVGEAMRQELARFMYKTKQEEKARKEELEALERMERQYEKKSRRKKSGGSRTRTVRRR